MKSQFSDLAGITELCPGTALYSFHAQCPLKTDVASSFNRGSRLKSSKSACCLGSIQDQNKLNSGELRHSSSVSTVALIEHGNATSDTSSQSGQGEDAAGRQINPAATDGTDPMVDKNSPFEDLEHYVTKFEPQPGNDRDNSTLLTNTEHHQMEDIELQNHLKDIVTDVHNSIGNILNHFLTFTMHALEKGFVGQFEKSHFGLCF